MNYWTKVFVGLCVAGGLVGAVKGLQYLEEKDTKEQAEGKKLLTFDSGDVTEFKLSNKHGMFAFKKGAKGWELSEPKEGPALDSEAVDELVNAALKAESEKAVLEEFPAGKRKDFGFEPATVVAEFFIKDKPSQKLEIGAGLGKEEGGKAGNYYVASSVRTKLFVLDGTIFASLNKSLTDIRSKKVADFKIGEAFSVKISGTHSFEVARNGTEWKIMKPREMTTDSRATDAFLEKFTTLKVDKITDKAMLDDAKLTTLGLNPPTAIVELLTKDEKVLSSVKMGHTSDAVNFLLPDGSVGTLPADRWQELEPALKVFRERRVLKDVPMNDASRLIIGPRAFRKEGPTWYPESASTADLTVTPTATVVADASAANTPAPTVSASPAAAQASEGQASTDAQKVVGSTPTAVAKAEAKEVLTLAQAFEFLVAEEVFEGEDLKPLSEYGLENPARIFAFEFADSKIPREELLVGSPVPGDEKRVYIKRSNSGTVFVVDAGEWLTALSKLADGNNSN